MSAHLFLIKFPEIVMKATPLVALALSLMPVAALVQAPIAQAQLFVSSPIQAIAPNTETLYLNTNVTVEQTLQVGAATNLNGRSIPAGAIVRGRFEPAKGGVRYVATAVEVGNQVYAVNATSELLRDIKDPRETNTGAILTDAGIGAAGGAAVGGILTGRVSVGSILGGAAAGAIIGNTTAQRVVVLEPNQTLTLTSQ
ncbi:MAG: hypothetical protein DCF17_00975 [Shackletoniella antarctica]|jgi:hypothetical protein|uniref:Uncharacterized protein n=1 Tax=Shackletoniella antarctica TaxID=268115 RepID=A0A2W4WK97_9CYAN|nr:MAG: hypothetical protein DCF17_00975 [Shackletoniella antarctica]